MLIPNITVVRTYDAASCADKTENVPKYPYESPKKDIKQAKSSLRHVVWPLYPELCLSFYIPALVLWAVVGVRRQGEHPESGC